MPEISKKITEEIRINLEKNLEIEKEIKNISDLKEKIEEFSSQTVSELLEIILGGGVYLNSSDIHIEPEENQAKIRVRMDGILVDITTVNNEIYTNLLSRIKLLSGIKLNVTDRPQDGRFSILLEKTGVSIEVRVSTLPAEKGESIVLRILNPKNLIDIAALGLREDLLAIFEKEIKKPNGMIIVTGPTGSGKTTTLYAFLKEIQKPEIKIITIEDPIEYHLEGISQTQTSPAKGYDFASGLKSIMRQDPDVILVGEIRDLETAQIGLQAALTGHLVLTTLHTNDAAGTIVRLQALGEKPVNIAPAINMAIAQRLIRKVCKDCSELRKATPEELKKIKRALQGLPKKIKMPKITDNLKIPQAKGCENCNFTGYKGRVGIFEAFLVDEEIEKFILTSPSISDLKEKAIKKGMMTMYQDGLIRVLAGITTIEELERISGEEES